MTGSRLLGSKAMSFVAYGAIITYYFFCFFVEWPVDTKAVALAATSRASTDGRAKLGVIPNTPTSVDCVNCCRASYDAFMLALRRPCCT